MDINYNNKYAYAEVWAILEHLGDEYKNKVPKNFLRLFKDERKFGYRPEIDFSKPLNTQVRQETKNIIAFLEYKYWLEDENRKAQLKAVIDANAAKRREAEKLLKMSQRAATSSDGQLPLNAQIDRALKNLK